MKTLEEVKQILSEHKETLYSKYGIEAMAVFGSVSRGDTEKCSDIDILVEFSKPVGIEFIDLADELECLLSNKVDLVSRNGIKPRYFKHIADELSYV